MNLAAPTILILSMASVYALEKYKKCGKYKRYPIVEGGDAWYVAPAWIRLLTALFYGVAATSLLETLPCEFSDRLVEILFRHPPTLSVLSVVLSLLASIVERNSKERQTRQHKRLLVALLFSLGMVLAGLIYNSFDG